MQNEETPPPPALRPSLAAPATMKTSTRFALVLLALLALIFAPAAARAADAAVEPATTRPPADARAPRPLAKLCESCEAFVENGEAFLNDPATQEKFQAYAVKACETAGKDKNMVRARTRARRAPSGSDPPRVFFGAQLIK